MSDPGKIVLAPQVGLEPTTRRLTAACSTIELLRNEKREANYSMTTDVRAKSVRDDGTRRLSRKWLPDQDSNLG